MGPPRYIASVVEIGFPREYRTELAIRLITNYTTLPNYLIDAAEGICRTTAVQIRKSFNLQRQIGDIGCLLVAFFTAPPAAIPYILIPAILALTLRDANSYPAEASGVEGALDVTAMVGAIALVQGFLLFRGSPVLYDGRLLLMQLGMAVAMVSGWRLHFRMKKRERSPLLDAHNSARAANITFVLGILALGVANTRIFVVDGLINHAIILIPEILIIMDMRQRSDAIGGLGKRRTEDLSTDPHNLKEKQDQMMGPLKPMFWWSRLVGPVGFAALFFPIPFIAVLAYQGRIPAASVNWLTMAGNSASFIVLVGVWSSLKKIHLKVYAELAQAIAEGRTK